MKKLLYIFAIITVWNTNAQFQKSFGDYAQFYPIGDDPNIRLLSSYTKQETILFEANPILRLSFYNNMIHSLLEEKHPQAWYLSFKPQLRMYTENSLPVKTPSYRIFFGTQHLFAIPAKEDLVANFLGFSLESGHYSNGQNGCAFSDEFSDGSSDCQKVYKTITPSTNLSTLLNRRNANFSTNMTKIILNYRTYKLGEDYHPKKLHTINIGYVLYHNKFLGLGNFGGYTYEDIQLYGKHRFLGEYEYMKIYENNTNKRYTLKQKLEYIHNPHNWVEPFRLESIFSIYPFNKSKSLGFLVSYIYGHDNYNYRFVDSGHQVSLGITWSQFPPIALKNLDF